MDNNNDVSMAKSKLLSIKCEDISKSFIEDMFAAHHDKESNSFKQANFITTMKITLTKNEYQWIDSDKIETTIGRLLFNRYILERNGLIEYIHYWNIPINAKNLSKLNTMINNLVIIDKITTKDLGNYIDSRDRLGFWCSAFLSVSISKGLILPMENVNKRKKELFKENEDKLNSNNSVEQIRTMNNIEGELMDMVRGNLKDDSGYDLYASGDGNLNNNYKTINVTRGAVYNNITKKYDIVQNSLMDGIGQKNIPAFANSIVAAAYPSAVGTAAAGYMSKKILALLQSERINPDSNSDCGTKVTIPFTVTEKNKQYVLFRNLNVNGKIVKTTLENIDSFVGKTVNLYSPQCCKDKMICGKCAGQVFYNLGVSRVGLLITQITMKLLNIKLKSKHDLSQSAGVIPQDKIFVNDTSKYIYFNDDMMKNKYKMKMFIPRVLEEMHGFIIEPLSITTMGIFPVKFYDNKDHEVLHTLMTAPAMITFNTYSDIQEDIDNYIVEYEIDSDIASFGIQQNVSNVEFFLNQIFLDSKKPQLPYNLIVEMMFNCLEINKIDLTGPSITYEMLARRVCRSEDGNDSFAKVYANNPKVDQMSYNKQAFKDAVQHAGVLQGILFQSMSESVNKGLAATLNGVEPEATPLEKIIKA